ncbi:MAG TPA: D-alanine--D-alanine ligase family protein [Spirochaetota bacterium]|nr:D-alanine--D-alanine ligase family protein [Spirochaetota bacterium]
MITVGILFGGRSGEHEVSRCSAASVFKYLDRAKYDVLVIGIDYDGRWYVQENPEIIHDNSFGSVLRLDKKEECFITHYERDGRLYLRNVETAKEFHADVIFPVVHGTFCEDGTLQGLLDLAMVPYVGAGVTGSAIGMDKDVAKRLLRDASIPVVPWLKVSKIDWIEDSAGIMRDVIYKIGMPCFVKPANAGSSVGITKVKIESDLESAVNEAFLWDNKILIEKGVHAREIEIAILGNEKPIASIPGEILPNHEFYSYEAKYIDADGAELVIPARIDEEATEKMQKIAIEAYNVLDCSGMARVDFFLARDTGEMFLNEINTLPGFTSISMYPKLWEKTGIGYVELLDRLIALALERGGSRRNLKREF